jgi:hypothetical protein
MREISGCLTTYVSTYNPGSGCFPCVFLRLLGVWSIFSTVPYGGLPGYYPLVGHPATPGPHHPEWRYLNNHTPDRHQSSRDAVECIGEPSA